MKHDDILDEDIEPIEFVEKEGRPLAITVICILGFIGAAIAIPVIFLVLPRQTIQIVPWYSGYLVLSTLVGLTCMIGLWKMKKWAAFAYLAFVLLNQVILINLGAWSIKSIIMPAVVIGIAFYHFDKMD